MRGLPVTAPVVLVVLVAAAGCGGGTDPADRASGAAGSPLREPLVVVRSGGLAGVQDTLRVGADGRARLTDRRGATRACRPDPAAVRRLHEVDLAAVPPPTGPPEVADGFTYSVTVADARATVREGDVDGRRAELVDAAAAVMASC